MPVSCIQYIYNIKTFHPRFPQLLDAWIPNMFQKILNFWILAKFEGNVFVDRNCKKMETAGLKKQTNKLISNVWHLSYFKPSWSRKNMFKRSKARFTNLIPMCCSKLVLFTPFLHCFEFLDCLEEFYGNLWTYESNTYCTPELYPLLI